MAGHATTLPITLDQMIYHAQSVVRARERSLIVVDIPFGYYQSNSDIALASAIKIMKESGGNTVKLEGGEEVIESVKRIVNAGVPVMGHLGLTPQSIYKFGTYTGIGAGNGCDGQVLVMHDMLGINTDFKPRFLRRYLNLDEQITGAIKQYIVDVKSKDFPNEQEQY